MAKEVTAVSSALVASLDVSTMVREGVKEPQ